VGGEALGDEDGRRPVHGSDDPDAARLQRGEPKGDGEVDGDEDAELARSGERQEHRPSDEAGEVAHGPDADEHEGGEELVLYSIDPEEMEDAPGLGEAGERYVREYRAEADGQQEQGLVTFSDCQVDEGEADPDHYDVADERPHGASIPL
jgi:hypothetical protein